MTASASTSISGIDAPDPVAPETGCAEPLFRAMAAGAVAFCLCDEKDRIRYHNAAFERRFCPSEPPHGEEFAEVVGKGVATGQGAKVDGRSLAEFVELVRVKRRDAPADRGFCADMQDGSWWWVAEHKLADGWSLLTAADISAVKHEELRLRRAHADALRAAMTDVLTGLPNRRAGMEQAEAAIDMLAYDSEPLCLALLDIDHFKRINDAHGHEVGDAVLIHFARALARLMGPRDEPSRIGGEEFMLVMRGTALDLAKLRIGRLMRALQPLTAEADGAALHYTFSAGVAEFRPGEDLRELLARADAALYAAKAGGRQRIESAEDRSAA